MKSTLLIICAALTISLTCEAQTEKGAKMIGGSGYATFGKDYSGEVRPTFGYFFRDGLAAGADVSFSYFGLTSSSGSGSHFHSSLSLSPFARYYFAKLGPSMLFANASGGVGLSHNMQNWEGGSEDNKITKYNSFGGGIGVAHFITEQVGLEAQLIYNNNQLGSNRREGTFGLLFGIQVHLPSLTEK